MTQRETVRKHLEEGGTLTAREALVNYGIMRLAARIHELRNQGIPVADRRVQVPTRNDETATVAQYYMEG